MKDLYAVGFNVTKTGNAKPLVARLYALSGNPKKQKKKLIATAFPLSPIPESPSSRLVQFYFPTPVKLDAARSYAVFPEFA